ncbi:condensation domain-containing protein [Micromonospora sp. NPDC048868]|uniref:condensation domain-containing protein n=1 Tax=Micromonospora sp. NPDC048868 TaxID=3364258 RepID=UPI003719D0C4
MSSSATTLTPQQRELWPTARALAATPLFISTVVFRLTGPVHRTALAAAVRRLTLRHDLLRAVFVDGPVPTTRPGDPTVLRVVEVSDPGAEPPAEIVRGIARSPFRLGVEPLFRVTLVRYAEDDHLLVLSCHQLVVDGYGQGLMLHELASLYRAEVTREPHDLPEIRQTYPETAHLLRDPDPKVQGEDREFWTSRLADLPTMILPADRSKPAETTLAPTGTVETTMPDPDGGVPAGLRRLRVSPFALFAAATMAMLHRRTGQTDLWVATVVDNRLTPESRAHVGPLASPSIVRVRFAADATFGELARAVQREAWATMERQSLPFKDVIAAAAANGADMHNLARVGVSVAAPLRLPDWPLADVELLEIDPLEGEPTGGSSLGLLVEEQAGGYRLRLEFDLSLFSVDRARDTVTAVAAAATAATADPTTTLSSW